MLVQSNRGAKVSLAYNPAGCDQLRTRRSRTQKTGFTNEKASKIAYFVQNRVFKYCLKLVKIERFLQNRSNSYVQSLKQVITLKF